MTKQELVNKRLELLQSGFKKYVSARKLPMDAETKWAIEIVALVLDFAFPSNYMQDQNLSISQKGCLYNLQSVLKLCAELNKNKAYWMEIMKG